jgi:hypothetical protein
LHVKKIIIIVFSRCSNFLRLRDVRQGSLRENIGGRLLGIRKLLVDLFLAIEFSLGLLLGS